MRKVAIHQQKRLKDPAWYNTWIQSPLWLRGFGGAVVLCLFVYALNVWFGSVDPGSAWGIGYGIAAAVLFLGAFFYAFRRRVVKVRGMQRAWYYLQFHVYGGTLFLLLMLLHTNFQWPQGTLTWMLWAGSIWVVVTGWLGSALQKWIPTVLHSSLDTEVNYNRIPELVTVLQKRLEAIVEKSGEQVTLQYEGHLREVFTKPTFRWQYLFDAAGSINRKQRSLNYLKRALEGDDLQNWQEIQDLHQAKLEIDAHYTLQSLLRSWLVVHIPFAVITLLLLFIHVFVVVYY